jgi:hypothetical protein
MVPADGGALVVFTHAVAIIVIGGVFDSTGPEMYNVIAILSCRRDQLASLHLTRRRGFSTFSTVSVDCVLQDPIPAPGRRAHLL